MSQPHAAAIEEKTTEVVGDAAVEGEATEIAGDPPGDEEQEQWQDEQPSATAKSCEPCHETAFSLAGAIGVPHSGQLLPGLWARRS